MVLFSLKPIMESAMKIWDFKRAALLKSFHDRFYHGIQMRLLAEEEAAFLEELFRRDFKNNMARSDLIQYNDFYSCDISPTCVTLEP